MTADKNTAMKRIEGLHRNSHFRSSMGCTAKFIEKSMKMGGCYISPRLEVGGINSDRLDFVIENGDNMGECLQCESPYG